MTELSRATHAPAAAQVPAPQPVQTDAPARQGGPNARDRFDPSHTPNRHVSGNPEGVSLDAPAAREARADADPSFFRTILEVAETALRFIPFVNLFLAAARTLLLAYDWLVNNERPDSDDLTRLGLDFIGGMFPPAAALGHLGLNAWWGADNPARTELMAGYDRFFFDQDGQDTWLASQVRHVFDFVAGFINGGAETPPSGNETLYGADGSLQIGPRAAGTVSLAGQAEQVVPTADNVRMLDDI